MCGPHQVWPLKSEYCGRGVPTKVVCAECMKMCRLGGKNLVVKGLSISIHTTDKHFVFVLGQVLETTLVRVGPCLPSVFAVRAAA